MKNFIFYTGEGWTLCPTKKGHEGEEDVCENFQVLGFGQGETSAKAWKDCLKENEHIKANGFGKCYIKAMEVSGEQITIKY